MAKYLGTGRVLKGGQEVATVSYSLRRVPTDRANEYKVYGVLRSLKGLISEEAGLLTLRLEGGKEVPFEVTEVGSIGLSYGVYVVSMTGDPWT